MVSSELIRLIKVAGLSAGISLFVVNELGLVSKVEGNSMQPTFNPTCGQKNEELRQLVERGLNREAVIRELKNRFKQDRVLLNKWSVRDKNKLNVGDVVILISPRDPNKILIKRIVALPGDVIHIIETGETKIIDDGHCWVEGDNQVCSYDSNNFGQVPLGLVEGRVCYIVWPWNRIQEITCDTNIVRNSAKTILLSNRNDKKQAEQAAELH